MKSKNRGKHGPGSGGGESLIRNLFYLLIAMMITFFTLVTNKKWIMSQFASFSSYDKTEVASTSAQLTKLQQENVLVPKPETITSKTTGAYFICTSLYISL